MPSSNSSSLRSSMGIEKCCHTPGRSVNFRSTIFALASFPSCRTSSGVLGMTESSLFDVLDVRNRKLEQHFFDHLAHHAQWPVTGGGSYALPEIVVKTVPPRSLARLDHIEYRDVPWVAGECVYALNPVVGHQHPSCGKSLEDLGQCFIGQSVEFSQVIGAERTLTRMFCQVLRSEETVTRSPS